MDILVSSNLERLLYATLGMKEVSKFLESCSTGSNFYLEQEQLKKVRDGLYVPVTGQKRLESAVNSLYGSCGYAASMQDVV